MISSTQMSPMLGKGGLVPSPMAGQAMIVLMPYRAWRMAGQALMCFQGIS